MDLITLELIYEGLIAIVREMRANIIRTAYSSIIYEGQDFSCVIVDAQGQLVAKAPADNPVHIFPVPWTVRLLLNRFDDIRPGDVFLHNDPYTGGTHLNDVATIWPVFVDTQLIAFTVVRAHWGDIGGMTPGSISGQATEIYQEGVRIPLIRVYRGGEPDTAALDLIFANVRGERQRRGDFTATLVSCQDAGRKLAAMAVRYGMETFRASIARYRERAEAQMRRQIAAVPDGTYLYESYLESSGRSMTPLLARLKLTVEGDEMTADFAGSSAPSPGPTNVGPALAATGVFVISKCYLDPTEDANEGGWQPVHTHVPEGTFLNASRPSACGGMSEARYTVETAMMGALAAAIPDVATGDNKGSGGHVYVAGKDAKDDLFIFYEYQAGGTGAWNGGDGNNATRHFQEGDFASIQSVETVENEHPLLIERCELRCDSGGAGRWRGGVSFRRDVRVLADEALLSVLADRTILSPHGVCGGEAGAGNRFTVQRSGQEIEPSPIPGKVTGFRVSRGDIVIVRSAGGGGYGDPLDRLPDHVRRDVLEGYVSNEAARSRYGVVLTEEGVDVAATEAQRKKIRAKRTFVELVEWTGLEYQGPQRILPLSRTLAEKVGISEDDVVELAPERRAPLRAWVRLLDEGKDRAYVGPLGLRILGAKPGDRVLLRRLSSWPQEPASTQSSR